MTRDPGLRDGPLPPARRRPRGEVPGLTPVRDHRPGAVRRPDADRGADASRASRRGRSPRRSVARGSPSWDGDFYATGPDRAAGPRRVRRRRPDRADPLQHERRDRPARRGAGGSRAGVGATWRPADVRVTSLRRRRVGPTLRSSAAGSSAPRPRRSSPRLGRGSAVRADRSSRRARPAATRGSSSIRSTRCSPASTGSRSSCTGGSRPSCPGRSASTPGRPGCCTSGPAAANPPRAVSPARWTAAYARVPARSS